MRLMRMMFWILAGALFLLAGCQTVPPPQTAETAPPPELPSLAELAKVPRVTPQEVRAMQDAGVKLTIVDTRSREDYDEEHIQGAIFLADFKGRRSGYFLTQAFGASARGHR